MGKSNYMPYEGLLDFSLVLMRYFMRHSTKILADLLIFLQDIVKVFSIAVQMDKEE